MQDGAQVQAAGFPVALGGVDVQPVNPTGHLVDGAKTQPGHDGPQVFGDEAHQPDQVLGFAGELFSQRRVLGGDTHRAGVQVADPHHDAPQRHQGDGAEAELLGAQQAGHGHVMSGFARPAVALQHHPVTQTVLYQGLLGFAQSQLPGQAAVADGCEPRAPAPPTSPLIRMTSAPALATPAATVPTPTSETNLTLMRALGLAHLRS